MLCAGHLPATEAETPMEYLCKGINLHCHQLTKLVLHLNLEEYPDMDCICLQNCRKLQSIVVFHEEGDTPELEE